MKKIVLSLLAVVFVLVLQAQDKDKIEKSAIKKVIKDSYIDGIFNNGDAKAVEKGWYWDCDINVYNERMDEVMKNPSYYFVKIFENGAKAFHPGTTFEIPLIHVTGYAAIAVVNVFQDDKQIYTDYMNLYKLKKGGWQIVTKTYFSHQK